jgi:hypothetical protein
MSNKSSKNDSYNKKNESKNNTESNNHDKPPLIEGEERKVHEEIIDRRIRGGADLSKEDITKAYDRALQQWQKLPGSVISQPTDITLPTQKRSKSNDTTPTDEETHNDTDNGGKQD